MDLIALDSINNKPIKKNILGLIRFAFFKFLEKIIFANFYFFKSFF